jgi:hypothetical protein
MAGNSVEKKAIELVIEFEKQNGRQAKKVRNCGYDLISGGLKIEVKGRGADKKPFVLLNQYNLEAVERESEDEYRLYVVMNPEKKPKLIIFKKSDVLKKKKERRQWQIPLRKADFDRGIQLK